MSVDAPVWFKEQYNDKVMQKYQAKGYKLRMAVTPEGSIVGSKAHFNIMGKGKANKKRRGQAAVPMNAKKGKVEANLETWEAFDEVYTYDLSRMGANEKEAITDSGAMALGRATDQEIFDVGYGLSSAAAGTGVGVKPLLDANGMPGLIGGANAGFGLGMVTKMGTALKQADVPWDDKGVYCPLPSSFWDKLLEFKQFNSAEWVGDDGLIFPKGMTGKHFNGVNYFSVADEYFQENEADHYDILMWHKSAMGWANNKDLETIWDWDNRLGCWTVRMEVEGAGVGLLSEGIVRGRFKVDVNYNFNQ